MFEVLPFRALAPEAPTARSCNLVLEDALCVKRHGVGREWKDSTALLCSE
jgi:hypothetical protein